MHFRTQRSMGTGGCTTPPPPGSKKMLLLKNSLRYELQLSQVWIKSNGACFKSNFRNSKVHGSGSRDHFEKKAKNQSRWIISKLGLWERAQKTKHFPYKNHGLEINGSKVMVVLAFLLVTPSKFKMLTELQHVCIFL